MEEPRQPGRDRRRPAASRPGAAATRRRDQRHRHVLRQRTPEHLGQGPPRRPAHPPRPAARGDQHRRCLCYGRRRRLPLRGHRQDLAPLDLDPLGRRRHHGHVAPGHRLRHRPALQRPPRPPAPRLVRPSHRDRRAGPCSPASAPAAPGPSSPPPRSRRDPPAAASTSRSPRSSSSQAPTPGSSSPPAPPPPPAPAWSSAPSRKANSPIPASSPSSSSRSRRPYPGRVLAIPTILTDDQELHEIQRAARRKGLTIAEWVRQALRAARTSTDP